MYIHIHGLFTCVYIYTYVKGERERGREGERERDRQTGRDRDFVVHIEVENVMLIVLFLINILRVLVNLGAEP